MLATTGFGLIALFSVLSVVLGEDRRRAPHMDNTISFASRLFR